MAFTAASSSTSASTAKKTTMTLRSLDLLQEEQDRTSGYECLCANPTRIVLRQRKRVVLRWILRNLSLKLWWIPEWLIVVDSTSVLWIQRWARQFRGEVGVGRDTSELIHFGRELARNSEQGKTLFDSIFSNSVGESEGPVERKLRETGEWIIDRTERSSNSIGKNILMAVFQFVLPIWILSFLVASGIVKLPFSTPFLDDLIM
ncbi:hypothetical protein ACSBR2_039634 [Camellia fascicularis]